MLEKPREIAKAIRDNALAGHTSRAYAVENLAREDRPAMVTELNRIIHDFHPERTGFDAEFHKEYAEKAARGKASSAETRRWENAGLTGQALNESMRGLILLAKAYERESKRGVTHARLERAFANSLVHLEKLGQALPERGSARPFLNAVYAAEARNAIKLALARPTRRGR